MHITVKTLKGEMMQIQVQATTTIYQLKEKIQILKGFDINCQKIVYKGKATQNQDTVQKLNIKQKQFLVVMATIKKPQGKKQQVKKQQSSQVKGNQVKPVLGQGQNQQKKQEKKADENPQFEAKVNNLKGMGFQREQCIQALNAAFGDSDRAVQYLINGIPASNNNPNSQQNQGSASNNTNPLVGISGGAEYEQLREMLRNDPTSIGPLLEQLQHTAPQLYDMISQDPQGFEEMILNGGEGDEQYLGQGQQSMQPEQGAIVVSQAEQEAIKRLSELGFSKIQAAQAYIACDKNQEMAANLLFERLANGDIQQGEYEDENGNGDDDDNLFN